MAYFENGRVKIFYTDSGSDLENKKPTVFLLHGAAGVHLHWSEKLRKHPTHRVIAIDLPGHGRSRFSSEEFVFQTIEEFVLEISDMIRGLCSGNIILMGHSMGGMISQHLALQFSDRISQLILLCTSAKPKINPAFASEITNENKRSRLLDLVTKLNYSPSTPREVLIRSREILDKVQAKVIQGDFAACSKMDLIDKVKEIKCPTLIVAAEHDRMIYPQDSKKLNQLISNSDLIIIENAGHMVMQEKPTQMEEILLSRIEHFL